MTLTFEALTIASAPHISLMTYLTEPATPSADALALLRSWHVSHSGVETAGDNPPTRTL